MHHELYFFFFLEKISIGFQCYNIQQYNGSTNYYNLYNELNESEMESHPRLAKIGSHSRQTLHIDGQFSNTSYMHFFILFDNSTEPRKLLVKLRRLVRLLSLS